MIADEAEPTDSNFEKLVRNEIAMRSEVIQHTANASNSLEYFLNLNSIGRFENVPLLENESPAITDMAVIDNDGIFPSRNLTIKGPRRFFRIGVAPAVPWTTMKTDPHNGRPLIDEKGDQIWEGYCIDFAAKLAKAMDFDYELVLPKSGSFGDRIPGQTDMWDGLVGELIRGVNSIIFFHASTLIPIQKKKLFLLQNIDIAVAAMKMTAEREEVIDFVAPYYEQTGISIGIFVELFM